MNIIDGIGFSPDKMLQVRLFSYGDAQRYRLGVNHHLIPVTKPRCPYHSYHRDGQMRTVDNAGRTIGYEPNSYGEGVAKALGLSLSEALIADDPAHPSWDLR